MNEDIIEDGFGTSSSAFCHICGTRSMYFNRPGDARCSNCEEKALSYTGTCASCGKKFSDCECGWNIGDWVKTQEEEEYEWGMLPIGVCLLCKKPFHECKCISKPQEEHIEPGSSKPLLGEGDKWEIGDLIHTIGMHYQIAKLIMEQGRGDLLPSIMEDIYYFAQALPDFFIKGE